jgi:hypothetical protein
VALGTPFPASCVAGAGQEAGRSRFANRCIYPWSWSESAREDSFRWRSRGDPIPLSVPKPLSVVFCARTSPFRRRRIVDEAAAGNGFRVEPALIPERRRSVAVNSCAMQDAQLRLRLRADTDDAGQQPAGLTRRVREKVARSHVRSARCGSAKDAPRHASIKHSHARAP